MTITELKNELRKSFPKWQIIEFGAKNIHINPIEFSWINMYELKEEPRFNIFFHEKGDGDICVEIKYSDRFLFATDLSNSIDDVKSVWCKSSNFDQTINTEVEAIIALILIIK